MRDGRHKPFTNKLRRASKIIDVIDLPLDLLPFLEIVDEVFGVGTCALAGAIDVAGCLQDGDGAAAMQEFIESAAETLLVAIPGLGSVQVVFDLRQWVRDRAGRRWRVRRDEDSGILTQETPPPLVSYMRFAL